MIPAVLEMSVVVMVPFAMSADVTVPSVISDESMVFAGSATLPDEMVSPFCPVMSPVAVVVESVVVPVTPSVPATVSFPPILELPVVVSVPVCVAPVVVNPPAVMVFVVEDPLSVTVCSVSFSVMLRVVESTQVKPPDVWS